MRHLERWPSANLKEPRPGDLPAMWLLLQSIEMPLQYDTHLQTAKMKWHRRRLDRRQRPVLFGFVPLQQPPSALDNLKLSLLAFGGTGITDVSHDASLWTNTREFDMPFTLPALSARAI